MLAPSVQNSRRAVTQYPVGDLIKQLNAHPTETVVHMARRIQRMHQLTEEDTDIIQERLQDLRAQQLELLSQIKRVLPVEQSNDNMRLFLHDLEQLVDRVNSAPEATINRTLYTFAINFSY